MAIYTKNQTLSGGWVKKKEIKPGTRCYITTETKPTLSNFKNDDGTRSEQDVAKVMFEGETEPLNVAINKPSINALVDAFGEDSQNWIRKPLTAHTEKTVVGGKRGIALYLVPQGYDVTEDDGGYVVVAKVGEKPPKDDTPVINLDDEPEQQPPF
jgi:hypothetical protein